MVEGNKNKVKLLICYHKPAYLLKDNVMTPIHVGRANAKVRMGEENPDYQWLVNNMIGDDTGENISNKNDYYNEMTAVYWAWKNYEELGNPDYIGLMHYRRHFIFDENITDVVNVKNFDESSYKSFLGYDERKMSDFVDGYDFIAHIGEVPNVYQHYIRNQRKEDLDRAIEIVLKKYPDYESYVDGYFNGSESNFCNMCIFSRKIFFEYCEWIFSILEEFENQIDMAQKRFFISERLTGLFLYRLMKNKEMKYKKLPIAFLEEAVNVPIAIYAEEGEELTTAVSLYSILNNKSDYNSYSIYVFCEKERVAHVENKIRQYIEVQNKCEIQVIGTDDKPDVLPLVLDEYFPKLGKCIYIWGKVLTLHDLGEFYRICKAMVSSNTKYTLYRPCFYEPTNLYVENLLEGINCRITNIESLVKDFGSSSEDKRTLAQYIIGENDAFDALTEAVKKSNISVKTTRFSPYSVVGRQNVFFSTINNLMTNEVTPDKVERIITANNNEKFDEIAKLMVNNAGKDFDIYISRMELCKPFCNVQPFYEFTGCKLQRGIVFHAFQYVYLQQDVGCSHTGGGGCQN